MIMKLSVVFFFLCLSTIQAIEPWESLNHAAAEEAQKGDWEKALVNLKKSLEIKETSEAHHLMAQIELVHSQVDQALDHIKKAFALDPSTALKSEVKFHEAVVFTSKKDYKAAISTFKQSIDILQSDQINDVKSLEKVAIACASLGDIPTAVGYLKEIWKYVPQYQFHNGLPFVRIADKYDEQMEHALKKGQQYADSLKQQLSNITQVTDRVFLDIKIGEQATKRVVIGLYGKASPRGVKNFLALATCAKGPNVCYKGTKFHRIIKDFMIQGGDIHPGDGTGRVNAFGRPFGDDVYSMALMHDGPGIVQMANAGPDTNGGQFVVMVSPAAHLNGNHIVLGRVLEGMDIVTQANQVEVNEKHFPTKTAVAIIDSGLLK